MPDPRDTARPPVGVAPTDGDVPRRAPASTPARETTQTAPAPLPRSTPPAPAPRATTLPAPVREPAIPDPSRAPAPLERRLPQHRGKLGRIGGALSGLSEDLREWVELRIQIVQTEIQEQVEYRIAEAKMGAAAGLFAALGGFFLLVTLALLFGWLFFVLFEMSLLLAAFLGFLVVTLLLLLGALVAYLVLKPSPPPSVRPKKSP